MAINVDYLNERLEQLPLPDRQLVRSVVDALQAQLQFEDYERDFHLLASGANDALLRARAERFGEFAGWVSASILEALAELRDEMPGRVIDEAEWSEVDPEAPAGDCPCSPDEETAQ